MRYVMLAALLVVAMAAGVAAAPTNNPAAAYGLAWTDEIKWKNVVSIDDIQGATLEARIATAQEQLAAQGGGVLYFPAGRYELKESIYLKSGIVLRGADPVGVSDARDDRYSPPTKLIFPHYVPTFEGDGTPNDTAFKGIFLEDPAGAENCGLANLWLDCCHVHFNSGPEHKSGRNRLVFGCLMRNTAIPMRAVPDKSIGQHGWQRYPEWHGGAAIIIYVGENALVGNNRLPASGDYNFPQKDYVLRISGRQAKPGPDDIVWFDYDHRPGIVVNAYSIGAVGGQPPDGTPEMYPWGFSKGLVIRNNYIFSTGRTAIEFTGDGTVASFNVIRFRPNVTIWTNTGTGGVSGSSTNDNRAMTIRGWRWTVEGNDYEVYRNRVGNTNITVNDGEGLMHEDHVNSIIKDSKLINNKGNSYLSMYKTGGIDGLLVEGNDIRTGGGIAAIYVVASRNMGPYPCRNVIIRNNTTAGSGIQITGEPGENNIVTGNKHIGPGGKIANQAQAPVEKNEGYE